MNNLYNPNIQGVSVYTFRSSDLEGFVRWLLDDNGLGSIADKFYNNPTTYIRGIKIFPFKNVWTQASYLTTIKCNNTVLKYYDTQSGTTSLKDFKAWRTLAYSRAFKTIKAVRKYNDFRDYEPYTECRLYVPFIGDIKVSCVDAYDGLDILVNVNIASGDALFTVYRHSDDVMLIKRTAQVGFDVNVGGTDNYSTALRNTSTWLSYFSAGAINLEGSGGVQTRTPNFTQGWHQILEAGIKYGAKSIGDTITNGMSTEYTSIFSSNVETEFFGELDAILYVKRSDTVRANNAQRYDGYPILKTDKLKNFKGYTQVNDVHTNISSTSDEQEQVYNLLRSGVII